ncbi:unnamed protein product [Miscanthus lutarioriparius]|uniref:BED-type domain-containing protein n=1 Tax=Miscanthus lutarioriparius TaxID=422564 RepID=A0A811SGE7_9POAL|nr:unnamed protein product [Miscanthus lutarioriparius]
MSTEQGVSAPDAIGTKATNLLKRNSDDVGWEYGVLVDASNKDKVKCKLCDKEMRGGIHRLKEHLAHEGKNVKKCTARTPQAMEAKEKCKKALADAKRKREEETVHELEIREEVHVSRVGTYSDEVSCAGSSEPHKLGPIDKWTRAIDPKATKSDSLKQQQLNKELWKERTNEVHKYIARWAYTHDRKRRSIMNHAPIVLMEPPSSALRRCHMSHIPVRSSLILWTKQLKRLVRQCGASSGDNASNNMGAKRLLEEKRPHIFWTSCAAHTINLMLQGIGNLTRFKKVVDQAKAFTIFVYGHTRTLECLRYFTEGKEVVRPGVTRFASNFLTLSSMQEKKDQLRKMVVHSRWDSLKDVKSKKGKEATTTILSPSFWKDVKLTLTIFEPLVKVLRLVDGDVRPSMGFLYGELLKTKRHIKEAFGNVEARFKDVIAVIDKKMNGRLDSPLHLTAYLLNPHYSYRHAAYGCQLKKFQNREGPFSKKLARNFENFDYNPASWWRLYGYETPVLQKMATRILSLTSSSSGCERNWSEFEGIHTKNRNRFTTTRLNKLVYIQFNSKLLSKREKIKSNKITDVLLSSDTTEAQGFLQEGGDDYALADFRDGEEDEMEGTGIPWSIIGEAVGADE